MATWAIVLLFSVGAVALFAAGLSLTLMIKGHHIDGEISTNRHMRARGISCAVHDGRNADGGSSSGGGLGSRRNGHDHSDCADSLCAEGGCASCATEH
ncbi:MAG: hypothetical protein LBU97_03070 [Alistipes sp.]|nr:hypothetical protein [Alistipes sp.]